MKRPYYLATLLCAAAVLSACSSTKPAVKAEETMATTATTAAPTSKAAEAAMPAAAPAPMAMPAYLDPNSAVSRERSVYFAFDDFTVQPKYQPVIELQGKYLAANARVNVKVEGNADERGSAEYNLALGQKRAEAVTRALRVYGVKDAQMEATSWGKEKPKATGHDEAAWAQNRRADVVYRTH